MKLIAFFVAAIATLAGESLVVPRALKDAKPDPNPAAAFWKKAAIGRVERSPKGEKTPLGTTELRTLWTPEYLYVLFSGPYQNMHLKPNPVTDRDTVPLWDWDVVEVFIGSDFKNIERYREYEVSPQNEWVDLAIRKDEKSYDWKWNSGFESKVNIDSKKKLWHCAMRIPWKSVDDVPAAAGREYRANFYRIEGAPPNRIFVTWSPTGNPSFHTPSAFGLLKLGD